LAGYVRCHGVSLWRCVAVQVRRAGGGYGDCRSTHGHGRARPITVAASPWCLSGSLVTSGWVSGADRPVQTCSTTLPPRSRGPHCRLHQQLPACQYGGTCSRTWMLHPLRRWAEASDYCVHDCLVVSHSPSARGQCTLHPGLHGHSLPKSSTAASRPRLASCLPLRCVCHTSLRSGSCTCLERDHACILAASVGLD
jgi:hypothetical protein